MDQLSAFATSSVPKKKRKSKANLGRHAGRREKKAPREGAIVASFPSSSDSSSTPSVTACDLSREKQHRNAADYAKRKCAKKQQQVEDLLLMQCNLKQRKLEDDRECKKMKAKFEAKLVATNESTSKVTASLTGRVTRLSNALVNEKEKTNLMKKEARTNKAQSLDVMKTAKKCKDQYIRDLAFKLQSDKDIAVKTVRGQGTKRATFLRKKHLDDLSAKDSAHASAMCKVKDNMKAKAKARVDSVRIQGETKLVRSQRACLAARNQLKVCLMFCPDIACITFDIANTFYLSLFQVIAWRGNQTLHQTSQSQRRESIEEHTSCQ